MLRGRYNNRYFYFMVNATYITLEGLKKLQDELYELEHNKRREIARRIKEAKELGDLSENAEYAAAKEDQAFMEGRILELKEILKKVQVIAQNSSADLVQIGSRVTLQAGNSKLQYNIVGSQEADPAQGKISNESPLGRAILAKKIGDKVEADVPAGKLEFTIVEIE